MDKYNGRKVIQIQHEEGLNSIRSVVGRGYRTHRMGEEVILDAGNMRYVVKLKSSGNNQ